jgi:hypothetical protein
MTLTINLVKYMNKVCPLGIHQGCNCSPQGYGGGAGPVTVFTGGGFNAKGMDGRDGNEEQSYHEYPKPTAEVKELEEDTIYCQCGEKMVPVVLSNIVDYKCPNMKLTNFWNHSLPIAFERHN